MKIGMLTSSVSRSAGGIYDAMRWLARSLHTPPERTVDIFGLRDDYSDKDFEGWGGLPAKVFDIKGPRAFGYAPLMVNSLISSHLDLVHLHGLWMYPSIACMQWSLKTSRPYIISPHGMLDSWALNNSQWKKTIANTLYEGRNLKGAACLQAGSMSEYKAIRDAGLSNPVCVLPNGIHLPDDTTYYAAPPWDGLFSGNSKVMLYLGRLHPKKGLDNLFHAWCKATKHQTNDDWKLVIAGVGTTEYENELKNLCNTLALSSVYFIGPQYHEAKNAAYRSAAAFILPSFSEGLPMVILDAWSFGLPVLMTPQCNLSVGFEARAALHIEPEIESISQGLGTLFSISDKERLALGERGRLLAKEHFSWDMIAAQMQAVYTWMLGKGDKPHCVITD